MTNFTTVTDSSLDTNIVFYAFDPRDLRKHLIANRILVAAYSQRSRIALQVLSEFYRSATRKLMPPERALEIVTSLRGGMKVIATVEQDLIYAIRLHQRHNLQFFDAVLLATLVESGVKLLFSEDMQHESFVDGLLIVNPFKLSDEELERLLA